MAPAAEETRPVLNVLFLIDASGSMASRASDVRGGFNSYLEQLKLDAGGGPYRLSAITFDTQVTTLFAHCELIEVPALTEQLYRPGGSTALYDAIGHGLLSLGLQRDNERYLVVIQTDGEENSSRRYSKSDVVKMITDRTARGNWTFVYLGADQDAWAAASQLGIAQGNTYGYDGASTQSVFAQMAVGTQTLSHGHTASSTSVADTTFGAH